MTGRESRGGGRAPRRKAADCSRDNKVPRRRPREGISEPQYGAAAEARTRGAERSYVAITTDGLIAAASAAAPENAAGGAQRITLAIPPSVNALWRVVAGRPRKTEEACAYIEDSRRLALLSKVRPLSGPVSVRVELRGYPEGMRDLDNNLKCLFDAMNGALWYDDSQIREISAVAFVDPAGEPARVDIFARACQNPRCLSPREITRRTPDTASQSRPEPAAG